MNTEKIKFIIAMTIMGSIGLFVRLLPLASSQIVLARGILGCIFVLIYSLLSKQTLSWKRIKADFWILLLSGIALGLNWMLLFEAYKYTTISTATTCYYLAPVLVVLVSPVLLKEKLSARKIICLGISMIGIILIAGINALVPSDLLGVCFGLAAAVFYASLMLLNKFLRHVTPIERTIFQLGISALSLLPYVLFTSGFAPVQFTLFNLVILLIVGFIHTGFVYLLYFSSLEHLPSQSIAVLSYIDPVVAILISVFLLQEPMSLLPMLGSILIICSAAVSEYEPTRK